MAHHISSSWLPRFVVIVVFISARMELYGGMLYYSSTKEFIYNERRAIYIKI
jgi:hypothetical protein